MSKTNIQLLALEDLEIYRIFAERMLDEANDSYEYFKDSEEDRTSAQSSQIYYTDMIDKIDDEISRRAGFLFGKQSEAIEDL